MQMACVELSRGTAYGLALSQMALTVGSVLFFPAVKVQVCPAPLLFFHVINSLLGLHAGPVLGQRVSP